MYFVTHFKVSHIYAAEQCGVEGENKMWVLEKRVKINFLLYGKISTYLSKIADVTPIMIMLWCVMAQINHNSGNYY